MDGTIIPAATLAWISADSAASPTREICGLLFGTLDRIDRAAACANIAEDPAARFEIDPAALLAAYRAARAGGAPVIGHYHSHPSGSAIPSARDRAAAEPGKLWLIVGDGKARLWLAGNGGFTERLLWPAHDC